MKFLLVRLDKIGDLISTLPVDELEQFKGHEVHWVIAKGLGFLPKNAKPQRSFSEIDLGKSRQARQQLREIIQREKPDAAIVFYAPWWASWVLASEKVEKRFGRLSQWHSYLFLTQGLRQSRSRSEKHEADYNADLARFAFDLKTESNVETPLLKLQAPVRRQLFEKHSLTPKKYVVVHPGMAGSALNWPQNSYVALIGKLIVDQTVVVTGTEADEPWLGEIKARFFKDPKVRWLQDQLDREELLFILEHAAGVVAPSTGVAHLAASLGAPTLGIFSPLPAHHKSRWGSRGPRALALSPEVDCPARKDCMRIHCVDYDCMTKITPDEVRTWLDKL